MLRPLCWGHILLVILKAKYFFYKKELQKTNQKVLRDEKLIERKGDKLYVTWKGYNNLFNSWIGEKYII